MDIDDPNERPTLPSPPPASGPFDGDTERFFLEALVAHDAAAALAAAEEEAELAAWWQGQRRRALSFWVTAMMVLCAGVLAVGLVVPAVL